MKKATLISPALDDRLSQMMPLGFFRLSKDAQSSESRSVNKLVIDASRHFLTPFSRFNISPGQRFYSLKAKWLNEVEFLSDTNEICTCEAYQQIIGMGEAALPFIYSELQTAPDHWFWALKAITCDDPVSEQDRGDLKAMTKAWLGWLQRHLEEKCRMAHLVGGGVFAGVNYDIDCAASWYPTLAQHEW
jgi:hypothetical protein